MVMMGFIDFTLEGSNANWHGSICFGAHREHRGRI